MRSLRYRDKTTDRILRGVVRDSVAHVFERHGVSEPFIHTWRERPGHMGANDERRLKRLEKENSRFK